MSLNEVLDVVYMPIRAIKQTYRDLRIVTGGFHPEEKGVYDFCEAHGKLTNIPRALFAFFPQYFSRIRGKNYFCIPDSDNPNQP